MNPEFSWNQNGYGRNEYPHPHPQGINEAIQREIEKERIREEIIISEIVRRRVLEAEVRRELMMEREMALLQGCDGFPFGSSPVMGLESQMRPSLLVTKAGWSAEERLGMALKEKLKRSENGGLETLSFQRGTSDVRISEIKPASEGNIEKERIILLTKPDKDVSGSRRKDVTPPEVVSIELLDDVIANKISKEEWSCALCQIMATSEKDLNEHVLGKKHKLKVAALRARRTGKNYSIGLLTKKPTKSIRVKEKGVKLRAKSLFSQKGGKATSKKDDLPLSENPKSEHLKKIQAELIQTKVKEQKNESDPRKKGSKFSEVNTHKLGNIEFPADVTANKKSKEEWRCALCKVIATRENDLIEHVLGKKHNLKMAELRAERTRDNNINGLSPKKPTKSNHVEENGVKLKARYFSSQKGGKATSKKDDLPLSENPKSEHLKKTRAEVIRKEQKNENYLGMKGCKFNEVMNAHRLGNTEFPADVIANKKSQEEWRCALCQVIATSKNDLIEHELGKKHNSKVAEMRAHRSGDNHSSGLSTKKATMSFHVEEDRVKLKTPYFFSEKAVEATSKKDDLSLSENPILEHLKKTQAKVIRKEHNNENDSGNKGCKFREVMDAHKFCNVEPPADISNKKSKEWCCALCEVIATSENDLHQHVLGKKHNSKVAALRAQRTGDRHCNGLSPKKATSSFHVEEEGVKLKSKLLFSEKTGQGISRKDDSPFFENPKSEHLEKNWSRSDSKSAED